MCKAKSESEASEARSRARKYSSVLIFEDDNGFGIVSEDKLSASLEGVGVLFRKAVQELPEDWGVCYLMAWSKEQEVPFSEHIVKPSRAILNNAYAVNHLMYETIIKQLEKIYDPAVKHVDPFDSEIAKLQKTHNCFAINPSIAYQCDGFSFITSNTRTTLRAVSACFFPFEVN